MNNLYLMMNKPLGYVCSAVSDSHKTVYSLLPKEYQDLVQNAKRGERLHTVGRLDSLTTGLLLFTTDGQFSHYITSPENNISKTYEVVLEKEVSKEEQEIYIKKAQQGLTLPPDKKKGEELAGQSEITFISNFKCLIKINEGKFHQVRRTFTALGNCVKELKRIKISTLTLPSQLKMGEYREMNEKEISLFIKE